MLMLWMLQACGGWWGPVEEAPPPPSTTSRLIALEADLLAAHDRITELETRGCVTPDELEIVREAMPDMRKIKIFLRSVIRDDDLDEALETYATLDDLDEIFAESVAAEDLDALLNDVVYGQDLLDQLGGVVHKTDLDALQSTFVSQETLTDTMKHLATRQWIEQNFASNPNRVFLPRPTTDEGR
jgi:ethanolamine utilization cobalamin adenosyltransferase